VPLAAVRRGPLVESVHRGRYVFCDAGGEVLHSAGDPEGCAFLRSSAKPFQALPLVFSGAADALGLSDEELAVACASHSGEDRHLAAVRSMLEKAGLSEEDLRNGAHPPLYAPAAARLAATGEETRPVHGNCSGKHAGMLALCMHQGWDTRTYRDPDHPAQRLILETVAGICGTDRDEILLAGDGCGVPTFAMPLKNLALGFARLISGRGLAGGLAEAAERVRGAMRAHPYMVAGTGRFNTEVMGGTELVAKSGAEGVFAAGSPEGWGLALKVSDGAVRAVRPAARTALERRGVELSGVSEASEVHDLHGERVGEVAALPDLSRYWRGRCI
jgi:L-asparaginase II